MHVLKRFYLGIVFLFFLFGAPLFISLAFSQNEEAMEDVSPTSDNEETPEGVNAIPEEESAEPALLETDVFDSLKDYKIIIHKGDLVEVDVYGLTRLAIVEPGFIEIISAEVDKLILVGSSAGETPVYIWDSKGKRKIEFQVIPKDLRYIMVRMEELFKEAKISGLTLKASELEGKILITGKVQKERKDALGNILDKFGDSVINMTAENAKLIEIDVQVTELETTLTKEMGVNWEPAAFVWTETPPGSAFEPSDFFKEAFKIGDFTRTGTIIAQVNALIQESKAHVLSKPNVVVTDGDSASFLVGGEIPITTTTATSTDSQESVSYKSYGIDLSVTPTIKADKIETLLTVSIRDVASGTGNMTSFTTTSADTKLLLNDGQTVVLAGLIKQNRGRVEKGIPILRKIPVIGLLFNNINWTPLVDKEVVISLTPHILKEEKTAQEKTTTALDNLKEKTKQDSKEFMEDLGEDVAEQEADEEEGAGQPEQLVKKEKAALTFGEASQAAEKGTGFSQAQTKAGLVGQEASAPIEDVSQYLTAYVQGVQKKIAGAISYPYEAKEKNLEGTVTLHLKLLSDGKVNEASVKESSGQEIFDKDALNTAKIVAPFPPFPAEVDLEELEVTVPVTYSKEAVLDGKE